MGWPTSATVCAAEGHRGGRQRGFTAKEVKQLARIFGVSPRATEDPMCELLRAPVGRIRLPDLPNSLITSELAAHRRRVKALASSGARPRELVCYGLGAGGRPAVTPADRGQGHVAPILVTPGSGAVPWTRTAGGRRCGQPSRYPGCSVRREGRCYEAIPQPGRRSGRRGGHRAPHVPWVVVVSVLTPAEVLVAARRLAEQDPIWLPSRALCTRMPQLWSRTYLTAA
jgi:hypothetical protein